MSYKKIKVSYLGDVSSVPVKVRCHNKDLDAIFNIVDDPVCLEALDDFVKNTRVSVLKEFNAN